ncbi:Zn(2+) transporter ZRT3 [Aspergillus clavatus NRRL 1]|uniref:ZIP metal ion transporter, putative n=1 Tax=Aspergillus clavatus (strain ATCC 1007 / CBS 513.65 / DSM 816 / NCTC 3887 / NRRL 1 / QM 1276 / 107) TaxID=344612 RepID=A1CST8_ASPCL|nr:ZIP metal ion transporter, putative [Aspergillus clavatus NRRL 1]EAW06375.1 ZIP metal ion transporter, putative [Aspergillus clavatus NRRL 1]
MADSSDLRGWLMSGVSGIACVLGSSVICIDVLLRQCSSRKNFQIVNNNGFLSASLCLSAGVLLFTSLYSMLPTSKQYLTRAGFSPRAAAYTLIGLFLAGVIVIRLISTLIHRHIPSHVVDCAHTHEPETDPERGEVGQEPQPAPPPQTNGNHERTPLLQQQTARSWKSTPGAVERPALEPLRSRLTRRLNRLVGGVKPRCDDYGPCYGFSQTCGRECSKTLTPHIPTSTDESQRPALPTHHTIGAQLDSERPAFGENNSHQAFAPSHDSIEDYTGRLEIGDAQTHQSSASSSRTRLQEYACKPTEDQNESTKPAPAAPPQHHHHVPQNAFLSIGLQTSLAIALHKLPEGFITYATNHASPSLGMAVFVALFIHNISEGFAMALPLYLALHSRWKAMFWSSLLGGVSQPAGAGLAALWFWGAEKAGHGGADTGPSWAVYGGMFAATAGVMTSVGLQLFSEGLGLTHHRGLGIWFAIAGMGLMGLSFALTA